MRAFSGPKRPPLSRSKQVRAKTSTIRTIAALLLVYVPVSWGYPWDQDMVDQPSAKPQESAAPVSPDSVPTAGGETLPAPVTEQGMDEAKGRCRSDTKSGTCKHRVAGPGGVSLRD